MDDVWGDFLGSTRNNQVGLNFFHSLTYLSGEEGGEDREADEGIATTGLTE